MIRLDKQRTNNVVLTLTEKSEYYLLNVPNYYLFVVENEGTQQSVKFTAEDLSDIPERYNYFRIQEFYNNTDPNDLLDGKIYLTGNTSEWRYKVYESDTPFSADTLDIQYTTGKILEEGRLQVRGNDAKINDIYK